MRIEYDPKVDALYIRLSSKQPSGALEMQPHLHIDTTDTGELVGIEVLQASQHLDLVDVLRWEAVVDGNDKPSLAA